MRQFDARRLMALDSLFVALRVYESSTDSNPNAIFTEESVKHLLKDLEDTTQICTEMGLPVGRHKASSIIGQLTPSGANPHDIAVELGHLSDIIHTELESHVFLYIEPTKAYLYLQPELFGFQVAERFPSASDDIEEAGKCLALNRATACVFHLMRVLEFGLYVLAEDLAIDNIRENWQNAIDQIDKAIRSLPKTDERKDLYADAATNFMHIKDAWRNRTMHVGRIYTDEKAQQIFDNTKVCMQALATRLSEKTPS